MLNLNQSLPQLNKKSSLVWDVLDAIFPPFCCNCGYFGYELCPNCINQITVLDQENICPICGDFPQNGKICSGCINKKPYFDQLRSWGVYSGVLRHVIQKVKFNRGLGLIRYFSEPCAVFIKSWKIEIDYIVPVPLNKKRHHSRGFNQAAEISKPISRILKIAYKPHLIFRAKDTASQVGLNAKERENNVLNAFKADIKIPQNKSILLIDDIATTGSTLNECARALKSAGARKVYCFTLARTTILKNQLEELEVK